MNRHLVHTTLALLALILALAAATLIAAPQPQNLALLAASGVLWGITCRLRRSPWNGALLFALIWLAFPLLKPLNQHWLHSHADALLTALDSRLWGGQPLPAHFHYEAHPVLTDLLAACYFAFFPIVIGGVTYYALRRKTPTAARFYNGLIGIYGIGLIGYLFLPAAGPAFTTLPDQGAGGIIAPAVIAIVPQPAHRAHPLHHRFPLARRQTQNGAPPRAHHHRHYRRHYLAALPLRRGRPRRSLPRPGRALLYPPEIGIRLSDDCARHCPRRNGRQGQPLKARTGRA